VSSLCVGRQKQLVPHLLPCVQRGPAAPDGYCPYPRRGSQSWSVAGDAAWVGRWPGLGLVMWPIKWLCRELAGCLLGMKISARPGGSSGNPRGKSRMEQERGAAPKKSGDSFAASWCSQGLRLCNPGFRITWWAEFLGFHSFSFCVCRGECENLDAEVLNIN